MKLVDLSALAHLLQCERDKGKKVVLCHGCFDLMHPGHIKYLQAAKTMGDLLVVTVSPDRYVDKGPGRPAFDQGLRASSLAALECVDYVAVNEWPTAEETLRLLRPDVYVKGQEFEGIEDKTGKIQKEHAVVKEIGAEMRFTHEVVFSSTRLLRDHFGAGGDRTVKKKAAASKPEDKILDLDELILKTEELRKAGRVIVQTHGVFDLIHPGIIKHLDQAKGQGDVLVATVIKDKDVRRGPGRPIFFEGMRARSVASLEQVDFVSVVDDEAPLECVKVIKPDVFARGQAYKERDIRLHGKIFEEERELYFGRARLFETEGFHFSSSQIINRFLDIYPEETRHYLDRIRSAYGYGRIFDCFERVGKLKALVIGDGIIDEYHYTKAMGKSAKSHVIVNKHLSHEEFAGGAFAVANHLASICSEVELVTLVGSEDSREDFIKGALKDNVRTKFFVRDDAPTIRKKRYIDQYLNQKLFEVNYLNEMDMDGELEDRVCGYILGAIDLYDIVLVSDFGHGFITRKVIKAVEGRARTLAVNAQTNGANIGYNLITKYARPNHVCLDEPELRVAAQDRFGEIADAARGIAAGINCDNLIVTLGKRGSISVNRGGEVYRTPIFSSSVVDTVGAGDAFFAYTTPCLAVGAPLELVSFIGNAVGALAIQIVCNKKPVEKHELLAFIHAMFK